jgi:hypothetical protein
MIEAQAAFHLALRNSMKKNTFEEQYPHVAEWVTTHGWIEIGHQEAPVGFVVALDEGGLIWDGKASYKTLDEAFRALDKALAKWMKENL